VSTDGIVREAYEALKQTRSTLREDLEGIHRELARIDHRVAG